jgi:four helix bundle protein
LPERRLRMANGKHVPMEEMDFYEELVAVADWVWHVVEKWPRLAQDTVGKQLIRAADSVGANLVEGDGRYTTADGLHFFVMARASARETRYWLPRASVRRLLPEAEAEARIACVTAAARKLNGLIRYRRSTLSKSVAREQTAEYLVDVGDEDPFAADLDH